ncbi:hypothetical protein [Chitinimonas sp.]|uniref:hypothetical protein n=1 Tax=Chitinimonas sp. TaxID=1934313 RepID=UPI0035B1000E
MKRALLSLATLLLLAQPTYAEEPNAPVDANGASTPASGTVDDGPSNPCQQWGRVARGILKARQAGEPKRKPQSDMEKALLDRFYDKKDAETMSLEAAYAEGYKLCLPILRKGIN